MAKEKLNTTLQIRLTTKEKNQIKMLAGLYAGGNISLWIIYSSLSVDPKFLRNNEIKLSKRNKKKGGPVSSRLRLKKY